MKPVVVLPLLLCGLTGCADLSRSAYRDSNEINKYSRRSMAETRRNIPMAPIYPRGVPRNHGYAGYSGPGYTPYSASYFIPDSGPRAGARLSADVVPPPYSPGLYGPTRDASSVSCPPGSAAAVSATPTAIRTTADITRTTEDTHPTAVILIEPSRAVDQAAHFTPAQLTEVES